MSRTILISPSESIIGHVLEYLRPAGKDYSLTTVVFPGRRPSHFLRKEIALRERSGFIPPRIYSIDEFIDYLYEEYIQSGSRFIDTYDAIPILYEIHRNHPSRIGGSRFDRIDDFFPVAQRIFTELEEFKIAGVESSILLEKSGITSAENVRSLPVYYDRFYSEAERQNLSTRAMRYNEVSSAAGSFDLSQFGPIVIAGLFILTESERRLIKNLSAHDSVILLFQKGYGLEEHLRRLDVTYTDRSVPSDKADIRFHACPDAHGQVFSLTGILKNRLDMGEKFDERSVIVLPAAENLYPLIHQTLPLFQSDEYNISMGYPLARTPLYGLLNNLTDLLVSREGEKYYAPDYLRFVLHPYTKNIQFKRRSDLTRILFHTLEDYFIDHREQTFFTITDLEKNSEFLERAAAALGDVDGGIPPGDISAHLREIHDRTIRPFERFDDVGDLASKCIALISYIHTQSTARLHPLFRKIVERTATSFRSLSDSLISGVSFEDIRGYIAFLRNFCESIQTPFPGTPLQGLQVLGFLETRNLTFEKIFFLDANDDIISRSRSDDSIVPQKLRQELNMPTYKDRERLLAYYFDVLLGGAREVHFFYIEKDRKERSRFLERIIWETEKKGEKPAIDSVQYRVNLVNAEPKPIPKTADITTLLRRRSFSASALNSYLRCPLKYYYQYALRLEEKEDATDELDVLDIGTIVHKILAEYFHGKKRISEKDLELDRLRQVTENVFSGIYGSDIAGPVYLLKKQILGKLGEFIIEHQVPLVKESGIQILATEEKITATWNSFPLIGKIDRIEKRESAIYIVDYKISASDTYLKIDAGKVDLKDRDTWSDGIANIQLPFYRILYAAATNTDPKKIHPVFILLGKNRLSRDIEVGLFDKSETPEEDFGKIESVMLKLLEEITDEKTPFNPPQELKHACPGCSFRTICGTTWV
jgi:ATP-dependent helicase/nuclease subunit B